MIAWILSRLFPPKLGRIRDWENPAVTEFHEQGWAGNVKQHYRDGIQRYFAESWVNSKKGNYIDDSHK